MTADFLFITLDGLDLFSGFYVTQLGVAIGFKDADQILGRFFLVDHPGAKETDTLLKDVFNLQSSPYRFSLATVLYSLAQQISDETIVIVQSKEEVATVRRIFRRYQLMTNNKVRISEEVMDEDSIDMILSFIEESREENYRKLKDSNG